MQPLTRSGQGGTPRSPGPWRRLLQALRGRLGGILLHQAKWLTVGYGLSMAAVPVVSRLAGPAEVGAWLFVASCISILVPMSNLRLDVALLGDEREEDVRATARAGLVALLLTGVAGCALTAALLLLAQAQQVAHLEAFDAISAPAGSAAVGIGIVLSGGTQLAAAVSTRYRDYRTQVVSRAVQLGLAPLLQIALVWGGLGGFGLILGDLAGRLAGILYFVAMEPEVRAVLGGGGMLRAFRDNLRARGRFPWTASTASLWNSICVQFPIVAVTLLFGTQQSGMFGMAWRLLSLPQSVVGASVGQLILGETAHVVRAQQSARLVKIYRGALAFAVAGTVLGILAGPAFGALAVAVLGAAWEAARFHVAVLLPSALAQLVIAPASSALNLLGGDRAQLSLDSGRLFGYGILVVVALRGMPVTSFSAAVSVIQTAFYLVTGVVLLRACGRMPGAPTGLTQG